MTTKQVRDLCGLYCVAEFANYENAELFMYLIGRGVTRSLHELTAHDRKMRALLFDMWVEASAPGGSSRRKRPSKANASSFKWKPRPNRSIELRQSKSRNIFLFL